MNLLSLLIFIIILGLIIFIHELGHFLAAKKSKVYVEEFSLGMGPKIYSFKRKNDETTYSLRAFPIGGFVSLINTEEEGKKVRKDQVLENKSFFQKISILLIGILFNFLLAIFLLFLGGLIFGSPDTRPFISSVEENSPAYISGIKEGDLILKVENKKVDTYNDVLLELTKTSENEEYVFLVREKNKTEKEIVVTPTIKEENGEQVKKFGIAFSNTKKTGFINAVKYSINEFLNITKNIFAIIISLFSGNISIKNISGPIGIYSLIDNVKSTGFFNIIYLTAYLSVNIGIINLIPLPIFDGGRALIVFIEKILNKKVDHKIENVLNYIGFILLIILSLFVTFNDILKLF